MSYLYSGTVRSWQGTALRSTSVTVYTDAGGTTPASLTDSGGTPIANPTTTDDRGRVEVYSTSPTLWYKVAGDSLVMRLVRFCDLVQATLTGPWFNVTDYGAVGDGNGNDSAPTGTNNYAALVSLQSTIAAAGGGTMYFPKGTYRCSSRLTKNPLVHWVGEGDISWLWGPVALDGYARDLRMGALNYAIQPVANASIVLERCRLRGGGGSMNDDAVVKISDTWNTELVHLKDCKVERNLGSGNNISFTCVIDSTQGNNKKLVIDGGVLGYSNGVASGCPRANLEMLSRVDYDGTGYRPAVRGARVVLRDVTVEDSDYFNLDFEGRGVLSSLSSYDHWGGEGPQDFYGSIIVDGCVIKGGTDYGIMVESPANVLITGNEFWAVRGNLMCINGNTVRTSGAPSPNRDYLRPNAVRVIGNTFLPARSEAGITVDTAGGDACIRLVGTHCLIEGNTFRLVGHNGIRLDEGSAHNLILGNLFDDAQGVMNPWLGSPLSVRIDYGSRIASNHFKSYKKTGIINVGGSARDTIIEPTNTIETLFGRACKGAYDVSDGSYRNYQVIGGTLSYIRHKHYVDEYLELPVDDDDLLLPYQTLLATVSLNANTTKYLGAAAMSDMELAFTSGSPAVNNVYQNGNEYVRILQVSSLETVVERGFAGTKVETHSASASWALVGKAYPWTSTAAFAAQPTVPCAILLTANVTGLTGYGAIIGITAQQVHACDSFRLGGLSAVSTIVAFQHVEEVFLPVNTGGGGTPQIKVGIYPEVLGLRQYTRNGTDVAFVERKTLAGSSWSIEEPTGQNWDFQTVSVGAITAGDSIRVHYKGLG